MKVKKFNESSYKSRLNHNYDRYRIIITSGKGEEIVDMPFATIEQALKGYEMSKRQYKENNSVNTVKLIKETSQELTEEEIEFLSTTNKYNI